MSTTDPQPETLEEIAENCAPHYLFHMGAAATREARARLIANILEALRNERKRCAKIARLHDSTHGNVHFGSCAQAIAEDIEKGAA